MAINIHPAHFQGSGYWAVILGGSSGIGLATAHKLAAAGMHLLILHRDRRKDLPTIESHFSAIRAQGVQCLTLNLDALQPDNRVQALDTLKAAMAPGDRVRLLLHAIAKGNLKPMAPPPAETTTEQAGATPLLGKLDFQLTLDSMALSLADWVQALFEGKYFAADARVIGLTSEGNRKAWRSYAAVSVAKVALEALCRSIALEYAPYGIRCNVVQPGVTDTPSLRMIPGSETLLQHAKLRNPFGRTTRPEEVADVIYLLCRDEAAWINGALIPVDGGEKNQ